ncbi:MAG: putative toxin-antitoxin system toxin component, PIN family [Candidatus Bathyarchaeia archaeon]
MSSERLKVYLDSNVFIFGKERPESNSRIILDLAEEGKISSVVSYLTIEELREYFKRKYSRQAATDEIYYVISLPYLKIVSKDRVKQKISRYKDVVPDEDLPHLVSALIAEADHFVTYNRHFLRSKAEDYTKVITQADVVKLLGIKPQKPVY